MDSLAYKLFIKKTKPWKSLPAKEKLSLLFVDLGIDRLISDWYCYIKLSNLDKIIIKSKESFKLQQITMKFGLIDPEYVEEGGIKWRFISAEFDGFRIYVNVEICGNNEKIIYDKFNVGQLRELIKISRA